MIKVMRGEKMIGNSMDLPKSTKNTQIEPIFVKEKIISVWLSCLEKDVQNHLHTNFFDLGGTSSAAADIIAQLQPFFPFLSIYDLFEAPTITLFIELVLEKSANKPEKSETNNYMRKNQRSYVRERRKQARRNVKDK